MDGAQRSVIYKIMFIGSVFAVSGLFARLPMVICENFQFGFGGVYRAETFFGKNVSLLNSNESVDKLAYSRHIMDFTFGALCDVCSDFDYPALEFNFTVRNKAVWGDPSSIAQTTDAETQFLEELSRAHKHAIPRHIFWIREGWMRLSLNRIFSMPATYEHTFTLGAFSFQLGRGIALGDAYAVGPDLLGFYSDGAVDQYAFGFKFSGYLMKDSALSYDLYASIINNKSGNLGDTAAKIRGQEYGRLEHPQRGFGRINYLLAGKMHWVAFDQENLGAFFLEPYWLYNDDPEQEVEFFGDASSRLGTIGLAGEYESTRFAFGFDGAVNFGHQSVRGWDRNQVIAQNRNGGAVLVNSHALINVDPTNSSAPSDLKPYLAPFATGPVIDGLGQPTTIGKKAQELIDKETDSAQLNGHLIGTAPGLSAVVPHIPVAVAPAQTDQLFNAKNRYRDPYINRYKGAMFVADAGVYFFDKELRCATAFGIATGDDNPNDEVIDGDFTGFIGLQEIYSGTRVRSAFVLGGAGKLKRPLSVPSVLTAPSPFAQVVSGFTDLIFWGASVMWEPTQFSKPFSLYPNLLLYWKERSVSKFDVHTRQELNECARSFLGAEINLFSYVYLHEHLKLYFVGSVFIPGSHYDDIRGKPLNSEQEKALNRLDRTGFTEDHIPNLGNDVALTFNIGLEFRF